MDKALFSWPSWWPHGLIAKQQIVNGLCVPHTEAALRHIGIRQAQTRQKHKQSKSCQVGQAVPVHSHRAELQSHRVELRVQTNKDRLKVVWGEKPEESCKVDYALDDKQTANASGFTNLKLTCEVADVAEKNAKNLK